MTMERRAWTIARVTSMLLLLISLRIIYWQMVRGDDLQPVAVDLVQAAGNYEEIEGGQTETLRDIAGFLTGVRTVKDLESLPQPVIQRTMNFLSMIRRGTIYDRNGRVLAADHSYSNGEVTRFYSEPSLAHTIGYVSGLRTGVTGLELSYNTSLLGLNRPDAQVEQMLNKPITGSDLILTVDSYVQRAAENALNGQAGAILVMDAHSGAILALASAPRFDPNQVLEEAYVTNLLEGCSGAPGCQAPFLNRAAQALYPPGSTWKTITLIAGLDAGQVTPDTMFDFGEPLQGRGGIYYTYEVDGAVIPDPNHAESRLNLEMSYAKSANAAFARIGDEMPAETLLDYASRFGYGFPGETAFPLEIELTASQIARDPSSLYTNNWLRAVTAIGQGEVLTSPINIGMVILSVLNKGDLPLPYLVQSVREPEGSVISSLPNRRVIENLMNPGTAQQVRQMMIKVVEEGSGTEARIPGIIVGGKTGTAQVGGERQPHSWFAGFAQNEEREIVTVVLIENGGEGSQRAAPIFAEVAEAALTHLGEPVQENVPTPSLEPPAALEPPATVETPQPTRTPTPASTPFPTGEPTQPPETDEPAPSPTQAPPPTVTPTLQLEGVLPPDIPRDPARKDITETNPSCANLREMPEATGEFMWPSAYQALSGDDFEEGHPGLDLSAPPGSAVYAADTGLVIFAGWSGIGYGNVILIDHGNGYRTLYGHLSQISIYCGAKVEKGKLIGLSGNTGNSSGPHLHFEVRVPGGYVNPLKVLPLP